MTARTFHPLIPQPVHINASVQAAILIYGVYDMAQFSSPLNKWIPFFYSYLGGPEDWFPERYIKASPVEYLKPHKAYPVVLIIGGDRDSLYPHSVELKKSWKKEAIKYSFLHGPGRASWVHQRQFFQACARNHAGDRGFPGPRA